MMYLWYFFLASLWLGIWAGPVIIILALLSSWLEKKKPEWFK